MNISSASIERTARPVSRPYDFDALYRDHERQLRLWLRNKVRDSAVDDVSQEVWLRVSRAYRDQFDGRNFRAWMFRIAKNCVVNFHRKRNDMASLDEDSVPTRDVRDEEAIAILINRERRRRLTDCMAGLGHPRRAIVESRLSGNAYEECAAAIGVTKQEAYSHFFAAKKLLRACMQSKQPRSK